LIVRTRKSDIPDWLELTHSPDPWERRQSTPGALPMRIEIRGF